MMTNLMKVEAEGRARGLRGQRLADFIAGWFSNRKTGTGRRSVKYCKGRQEDGQQLQAVSVREARAMDALRKIQANGFRRAA